jgi:hypothetical protein
MKLAFEVPIDRAGFTARKKNFSPWTVTRCWSEVNSNCRGMFVQRAREAGPREKFCRLFVVVGRVAGCHLFEGDGEFVGIERPPLSDLSPRLN